MITKNFKARLATILQTNGSSKGWLSVKDTEGTTRYLGCSVPGYNIFPGTCTQNISFGSSSGIWLGSGNTPASEEDYNLESRITSGLSAASPSLTEGIDGSGNLYLEMVFLLSNTTSSDITVREIGYVQDFRLANTQGDTMANTNRNVMLDRTVLATPVTVPANDSAAIKYTLKTIMPSGGGA